MKLQGDVRILKRDIPNGKYALKMESEGEMSIFLTEVATGEKHFLKCRRESGTMFYEIPVSLKPARDYVVQPFYDICLGPGKCRLVAPVYLKFRTGKIGGKVFEF